MYATFSDSDANMLKCDEEISMDHIPNEKEKRKGFMSHCFICGKDDHVVKNGLKLVYSSVNICSLRNRFNNFVNNLCKFFISKTQVG